MLADEPRTRATPFTVMLEHDTGWAGREQQPVDVAGESGARRPLHGRSLARFKFIKPGGEGSGLPVLVVGQGPVARMEATGTALQVTVTDSKGKSIDAFTLKWKTKWLHARARACHPRSKVQASACSTFPETFP